MFKKKIHSLFHDLNWPNIHRRSIVPPSLQSLTPLPPADASCKPNFSQLINGSPAPSEDGAGFDAESIVGLVVWFVYVLYSSIRYGMQKDGALSGRGWESS